MVVLSQCSALKIISFMFKQMHNIDHSYSLFADITLVPNKRLGTSCFVVFISMSAAKPSLLLSHCPRG